MVKDQEDKKEVAQYFFNDPEKGKKYSEQIRQATSEPEERRGRRRGQERESERGR